MAIVDVVVIPGTEGPSVSKYMKYKLNLMNLKKKVKLITN